MTTRECRTAITPPNIANATQTLPSAVAGSATTSKSDTAVRIAPIVVATVYARNPMSNFVQRRVRGDGDRAVSPVVVVILLVAITAILAAVIGAFVLNLGNELQQSLPSAGFSFDFEKEGSDFTVTATHNGGDAFTSSNSDDLRIVADDSNGVSSFDAHGRVSAGDSAEITDVPGETDVRVIRESPDGSGSSIVAQTTPPSGRSRAFAFRSVSVTAFTSTRALRRPGHRARWRRCGGRRRPRRVGRPLSVRPRP